MNFSDHPFFGWPGGRRRLKRGLLQYLLLQLLSERPRHGYDFMKEFRERAGGWGPGAGSVYPTLSALEEAGYVTSRDEDGKRVYVITEKGVEYLKDRPADAEDVFREHSGDDPSRRMREAMRKVFIAARQAANGSAETSEKLITILDRARKEIYSLLANE